MPATYTTRGYHAVCNFVEGLRSTRDARFDGYIVIRSIPKFLAGPSIDKE